ncbi:MAG: signal protein PDZ, partial [Chitinophagaceae bacterium]
MLSGLLVKPLESFSAPAKLITKFPFTLLTGGIIIVQARVDHHLDTLNFVLDTGSGGISLDSTTVEILKLPVTASNRTIHGIAGIRNVSFVMNQTLVLPRLVVDSLNFHINDYSLLTSVYGMKIDGIIGFSFFSRYIVHINYDTHLLEVWEQGEVKYPKAGLKIKPSINNLPVFGASITDATSVSSRFFFDTGAGLCVLLSEQFVKDSSIIKKGRKIIHTQAEGIGGKKPMKITTVKEVKIGHYRFKKVPAYIFEDEFNITAYPQLGGLIGNDLFRRFNTIINYKDRVFHLLPNTHFAEPFDYSYTGLGMY